ncbi:hypothetical protein SAMN04488072_10636 [Lentibacillus halodurans]|uniref:Zinc-ribbon domain-containing protein n=1 Tax=Lentibacillus halodurans TaxID=237679 RepID=A0A1I0XV07_9BACI|nr:zinc ribbon domain-containing protein [Lentibacillus halodurans]SFB04754.1 hypothetical protein SAMN04488072_10636 [Lentibacillus halodurans]
MQCPSCGQQTAEGKFCTNCGAQLVPEQLNEEEIEQSNNGASVQDHDGSVKGSEVMEKLKSIGIDFGHFFVTLVKKPSEAKKANHSDMVSGMIMIVLFAFILALSYHFVINAIPAGFFRNVSFIDSFMLPFITFILLEFLIAGLAFAGVKLGAQAATFPDVIAKFGAYLIPFFLLYAVGLILTLIGISALSGILILISILGLVLFTPTFILLEQPTEGFDRIYVLLGLYIIAILAFGFFAQSFLTSILGNMMDTMFQGF